MNSRNIVNHEQIRSHTFCVNSHVLYVNFSVFDLYRLFNQCSGSAEPWLSCDNTSSWQDC
jgi:hypothetical protein